MRHADSLRPTVASNRSLTEAKLLLAEFLLGCDELHACAQGVLDWLGRHCGVAAALFLSAHEPGRLSTAASLGVNPLLASEFGLELEDAKSPLVATFLKGDRARFRAGEVRRTPLGERGFHALTLGLPNHEQAIPRGLLLARGGMELEPQAIWACEMMGEKLLRLDASGLASELAADRERALFSSLLNAVTDPILLTDTEGKVILANALAERLFTSLDDDSEGRRRAVSLNNLLFSSALASQYAELHEPTLRNELALVDPNEGSDLLFELISSAVRQPSGQTVVVSVLRNVTDLGRASKELGENQERLRRAEDEARHERLRLDLIIDSVADPIVVTDAAGDIVLMNTRAERFFAPSASGDEEASRRVRHNDAHFSSFTSKLFLSPDAPRFSDELSLLDPQTGAEMPMEAVAGRIQSNTGLTLVTIFHDRAEALEKARLYEQLKETSNKLEAMVQAATADIVQQNELLRRQAIALEQASAAKSQFLANMSHEFRTPLNAILGYTQMLLQGVTGTLEPRQKKSLGRVDSNARHLMQVINEILDITRIESGRMPLHLNEFPISTLVREVLAELEPIITRSGLSVHSEVGQLPHMLADRQKLKQILVNLITNAVKFTPKGSVRVRAKRLGRGDKVAISVSDTGIGIAEADRRKIFDDFQQVDSSTTRPYGGTGLGLAICRRLAQMMDGTITLRSQLNKGSTFTLQMPMRAHRE